MQRQTLCQKSPYLVALLIFVFLTGISYAEDITAPPDSDARTIASLLRNASAGDTVLIPAGNYCGGIHISGIGGKPNAPKTLKAARGAKFSLCGQKGDSIFKIENSSHLVLDGINVTGGSRSITLGSCDHITITNAHLKDMTNYGVMSYMSNNITITNSLIENSSFEHGIYVSGKGLNVLITDNIIRNTHINGIHINGKAENVTVLRNTLENIGSYPTKEGGAAITFINGARMGTIANNIFKNIYGQCLTINGQVVRISNNIFDGYAWSVLLGLPGAQAITFTNNAILEGNASPFQLSRAALASFKSDYNYFGTHLNSVFAWDSIGKRSLDDWQDEGQDTHSIARKSLFSSRSGTMPGRYELSSSSPAIDAGTPDAQDKATPPGLGSTRADIGIFGGPFNTWPTPR